MTEWRNKILHGLRHPEALPLPFSLRYDDASLHALLGALDRELLSDRVQLITPDDRLKISCCFRFFDDCPAAEWTLTLENIGTADTAIIRDLHSLDLCFRAQHYTLHRTTGALTDPSAYAMRAVREEPRAELGAKGGCSSKGDLPFVRLDVDRGTLLAAIGWSGQWHADVQWSAANHELHVRAGVQYARFYLKPGESVTLPRILLLFHEGEAAAGHSAFRRLLRAHYVPRCPGAATLPCVYCNTAFTREGYWRNECTAANQTELICALGELQPEVVVTGQGWYVGGWPNGAGNWTVDPAKFPDGMAPVAAAAAAQDTAFGLAFEPERVAPGTATHELHPDWLLLPTNPAARSNRAGHGLLNLALPEVRKHLLDVIADFTNLDGFGAYCHEFHLDPLQHWLDHDDTDRLGLTEIHYVNGLYAFLDELAAGWPAGLRINGCSQRIDLETIRRFHLHHKSDYWFDNVADQASLFALSQYLPNGILSTPLARTDDTSLHSVAASSICLGWIADDPHFDTDRALQLLHKYRRLAPAFNGDWYPLTRYDRSETNWFGSQYHDPESDAGVLLMFRREDCHYDSRIVMLHGLQPRTEYELVCFTTGHRDVLTGEELLDCYMLTLPRRGMATMIRYRPVVPVVQTT